MSKKTKYMDALAELSEDDSEDEEAGSEEEEEDPEPKKPKSNKIDLEALERCGYKSGPSVLLMPTPKDGSENNWGWGSGQEQKQEERDTESLADREANREAVNAGLSASVATSKKTAELKELQAMQRRQEAAETRARAFGGPNKKDQKDSWNQKEKRKREAGQATRGKNFVEEEKRLGRSLGMYSGFD